jgi:hypothetical protein
MNPFMGAMMPQGGADPMAFFNLMQKAAQNPEQGAQMLAGLGMEPPGASVFGAGPSVSPFAEVPGTIAPTPQERVSGAFDLMTPPAQAPGQVPAPQAPVTLGSQGVPFPEPVPGADPFPTPYPQQQAAAPSETGAAKANAAQLGNMLKGVSVPAAPEPQRVSSPGTPPQGKAATDSGMIALLTKLMSGQQNPVQPLRLSQALGVGGR